MVRRVSRIGGAGVVGTVALAGVTGRASAHVDYVTDPSAAAKDVVEFALELLADPFNAALLGGGTVVVLLGLFAYNALVPPVPDFDALRDALDGYRSFVPWMLRLSLGVPLVGAGFSGYLFSPAAQADARLFQVALGFLLLFGLASRAVAAVGLVSYLGALVLNPQLLLAFEYVPGFIVVILLGSGRPSADHMLSVVAGRDGTYYGQIDPVHQMAEDVRSVTAPYERVVPAVLRIGLGLAFIYLGLVEKLANPARALRVVDKYDLTAVVPVDPGMWVLGAGLVEIGVGLLLVAGLNTRAAAATAFTMLVVTLFGLPDDPVLAHVTLFGMLSAIFTLGCGPFGVDAALANRSGRPERDAQPATVTD